MRALAPVLLTFIGCSGGPNGSGDQVVDATRSGLFAAQASAVADNTTSIIITATVRDAVGAPIQGAQVTFTSTGSGNSLNSSGAPTSQDGTTNVHLASTKAEAKTVNASVSFKGVITELEQELALTFTAGPAEGLRFQTQPSTTKAGEPITPAVVLEVTDRNGNRSTGAFAASLRLVRSSGGSVQNGAMKAAVDGLITFDELVINRPQVGYALRAETPSGAADESALFDVTLGALLPATSTFIAQPVNVIADGASLTTLTLTARDRGNNALAGVSVAFTASGTGNTLGAATVTTDASGEATTTLASTVAEMKTVTATIGAASLTTTVTFIP